MQIFDDTSDKKLDNITLFLTKSELQILSGYARQLLEKSSYDHFHLSSEDYQKEVTICVYDPEKTENFHPRIQKLIRENS